MLQENPAGQLLQENSAAEVLQENPAVDMLQENQAVEVLQENPELEDSEVIQRKSRKRVRRPETWKKNMMKMKKRSGKEYENSRGNFVEKKSLKNGCSDKCRIGCTNKINNDERQMILDRFWDIGDQTQQRNFVINHLEVIEPKYRYQREGSNRGKNYAYYFDLNSSRTRVCKTFFLNTLSISNTFVNTALSKKDEMGIVQGDLRGKHVNHKKVDDSIKKGIREHIDSFCRIESHYCRADSKREYIDGGLTIASMYRMYKEKKMSEGELYGKPYLYETIFNTEFNISFHKPKKDLCVLCEKIKDLNEEEKQKIKVQYEQHLKEKELSRSEKKEI
ncbi:uncharacterized protein LOC120353480 isoform X1 [Nilaparvata lugens]|uniref:uncharacterized protein LOC120353480 isoform X1 n=1 Tax=Nilaparvata lugens TaxID=108931 RepID=UPI00193DDC61|nr:uncharacterized protein LOC120353480 isoform X1 [Nilaparvata lugens]